MKPAVSASARQKAHYEAIHSDYEHHYYDAESMAFRERFYYAGLDLNGCRVPTWPRAVVIIRLRCSGIFRRRWLQASTFSTAACKDYRRNVGRPCFEVDLTGRKHCKGKVFAVDISDAADTRSTELCCHSCRSDGCCKYRSRSPRAVSQATARRRVFLLPLQKNGCSQAVLRRIHSKRI